MSPQPIPDGYELVGTLFADGEVLVLRDDQGGLWQLEKILTEAHDRRVRIRVEVLKEATA